MDHSDREKIPPRGGIASGTWNTRKRSYFPKLDFLGSSVGLAAGEEVTQSQGPLRGQRRIQQAMRYFVSVTANLPNDRFLTVSRSKNDSPLRGNVSSTKLCLTRTSRARHGGAEGGRPGTESNLRSLTWNFKIILKNQTKNIIKSCKFWARNSQN